MAQNATIGVKAYTEVAFMLATAGLGELAMLPEAAAESVPPLRSAYIAEVQSLEDVGLAARAAGQDAEATARMLHQMRRDLGVMYKDLTPAAKLEEIYARNLKLYGDKLGPSIEYLRAQGKTWEQIIESAARPGGKDLKF